MESQEEGFGSTPVLIFNCSFFLLLLPSSEAKAQPHLLPLPSLSPPSLYGESEFIN